MTWKSELAERITTIERLTEYVTLEPHKILEIEAAEKIFPWAIPAYYASLMDKDNPNCPIRRQAIPDIRETAFHHGEFDDPLGEEDDSPVMGVTYRYPDRALLLVTNHCFMFCRHCNRRRKVGHLAKNITDNMLETALKFIEHTTTINDVLISGGDPFFLSDEKLDWILTKLRQIPHVKTIRIGTRAPVVMPSRITDSLVRVLKKAHPLWLNTHFNHPKEITAQSSEALRKLADAGIPLGNQTVLLRGVNDCPEIIKTLCLKLVEHRVRPYYLFQCDLALGIEHFRTKIARGMEIMESLIGHIRGYAVPTYALDPPGGAGKIPLMPNYVVSHGQTAIAVRNYEGVISKYYETQQPDSGCPPGCTLCNQFSQGPFRKGASHGVADLLNENGRFNLVPNDTQRARRK